MHQAFERFAGVYASIRGYVRVEMTPASVRRWLPSKKGAARAAEGQDLGKEGGMILFQQGGTIPLYIFTAEVSKWGTPHKSEAIGGPTFLI